MTIEKFEVRNRWTNRVQFTAKIEVTPDMSMRFKLGLAVKWARKNGADLRGVDLRDADLSGVDLRGVDLRGAVLRGVDLRGAVLRGVDLRGVDLRDADLRGVDLRDADLRGAVLRGVDLSGADLSGVDLSDADLRGVDLRDADLRAFKADFWMILLGAQKEAPGLIKALKAGRVNGSTYSGECACLVGTIANVRGTDVYTDPLIERDASRPAEQWFLMIREGDKPGDDTGGGFAAGKALEWAQEFQALLAKPKVKKPAAK